MKRFLSIAILAGAALNVSAAELTDSVAATIADHLKATGKATITQPAKLNDRLRPAPRTAESPAAETAERPTASADAPRTAGGFRILVFSGNNPRTAKNEATNRSELLARQFPEYATYITYDAPYWRLKAGDFRSYDEATSALGRLKTAMPSFAREMRVVRERINL